MKNHHHQGKKWPPWPSSTSTRSGSELPRAEHKVLLVLLDRRLCGRAPELDRHSPAQDLEGERAPSARRSQSPPAPAPSGARLLPPPLHTALPASSSTMSRTHTRPSVEHTSPPCLPPPPSGALHVTSVCPTGEDLPPPERARGHPSAENTLLQSDAERRLPEAGAARQHPRPQHRKIGNTPLRHARTRAAHAL